MSSATALRGIGHPLDDTADVGRTLDELLAARTEPPALFALGEPTHGIKAFPLLRNEVLGHLVDRGFRSIVLEIDAFAASIVDDYVSGGAATVDEVLATGFSHGFGSIPGNRELVEWLRSYNSGHEPRDQIHFYGFDAPTEYAFAPSPRRTLAPAINWLPAALRPESAGDLESLVGDEADWTNPAAMYDPAASIGRSDRARALRILADDLVSVLRRAAPGLRLADPTGHADAVVGARTALSLLRYHAAMASPAADRIGTLVSLRAEMMADNLLTVIDRESLRGPSLVFAHNCHFLRARSDLPLGEDEVAWYSAGALVALTLGERYLFAATDAKPDSDPKTLQGVLAEATTRRTLFPTPALRETLPPSVEAGEPILPGHLPLKPAELAGTDAVIFIADTDGKRHQYW